jgi:hypothetical protein
MRREDALLGCAETGRTIADLTRAIELSPGDAHSFFSRAREETEQKGNVKALADLDRSLALEADDPQVLQRRAALRLECPSERGGWGSFPDAARLALTRAPIAARAEA